METLMYDDQTTLEEIVLSLQEDFDEELFRYLISRVKPLIRSTIAHYDQQYIEYDDLYQECVITLHRAVLGYKVETKAYFISYYRMRVRHHLQRLFKKYYAEKRGQGKSWLNVSLSAKLFQNDSNSNSFESAIKSSVPTGEEISIVKEVFESYVSKLEKRESYHVYLSAKGHTVKEISEKTGLTLNQTRYVHRKCRQKFDDFLVD